MRLFRAVILVLVALAPLATLVHRNDVRRWEAQHSAMTAPDEFSYLLMARHFLQGGGLSLKQQLGQDTFYPPGYPLLLAGWTRGVNRGTLTAFTAHAFNAALLSIDGILAYFLARRLLRPPGHRLSPRAAEFLALLIAALFAANWHVLDSSLVVMSEPAFMLATFSWLLLALRWSDWQHRPARAAAVGLLAVVAWSIRGAGITCVAATALFVLLDWFRQWRSAGSATVPPSPKRPLAALAVVLALPLLYQAILAAASPAKSLAHADDSGNSYTHQLLTGIADRNLHWTMLSHLKDFSESFIPWLREPPDDSFRSAIGIFFACISFAGLLLRCIHHFPLRRSNPAAHGFLELYIVLYVGLYLFWPFNAARFWTPILPVMLVYAATAATTLGSGRRTFPRTGLTAALLSLLLVLHVEEDFLQLGNRARRLNYVSDSLADAMRAIRRDSAGSSPPVIAGMGSDERFLAAWHYSQISPDLRFPILEAPAREHADDMLLRLLKAPLAGGDAEPRSIYFIAYFPVGQQGIDVRDTLAGVAKKRPDIEIKKIFQKEIIISVWKLDIVKNP
jgi:hypothetical protein